MAIRSLARIACAVAIAVVAGVACGHSVSPDGGGGDASEIALADSSAGASDAMTTDATVPDTAGDAASPGDVASFDSPASDAVRNDGALTDVVYVADTDVVMPPPGVVVCGGEACAGAEICCLSSVTCYDPSDASACPVPSRASDPSACASNAQCPTGQWCAVSAGDVLLCSSIGTCRPPSPPSDCGGFGAGVCGCDGRTYASPCAAEAAGVRVSFQVPCGTRAYPSPDGTFGCDATHPCSMAGWTCDLAISNCVPDQEVIACGLDAQCPSGSTCCAINGVCTDVSRPDLCIHPPPGSWLPCSSDADCAAVSLSFEYSTAYCGGPGCGPAGGCFQPSNSCTGVLAAVCGCDGMTYTNACWASAASVRVAHDGMCP